MPRSFTKTKAFDHFGVPLENAQWSWSGMSHDGQTVAVVLWQDAVKGRNGQLTYHDDEELQAEWRQRIGNKRRIEHLRHSLAQLDGRFRPVIAKAEDMNADPRKIEKCFPQEGAVWQIDYLDDVSGAFRAHIIR